MWRLCKQTSCDLSNTFRSTGILPTRIISTCPVSLRDFDYERIELSDTHGPWFKLTGRQSMERFIPVTRKALIQEILEDESIIEKHEIEKFQELATGVDSALTVRYRQRLNDLKVTSCLHFYCNNHCRLSIFVEMVVVYYVTIYRLVNTHLLFA